MGMVRKSSVPFSKMSLQEILDQSEVQVELDRKMRSCWAGIPEDFKPALDLLKPHQFQDKTKINIKGVNNYSDEVITLKELNYLYLYCFVQDFFLFYNYERATAEERLFYGFPELLSTFVKFSYQVDPKELESFVQAYRSGLMDYVMLTGRDCLFAVLD